MGGGGRRERGVGPEGGLLWPRKRTAYLSYGSLLWKERGAVCYGSSRGGGLSAIEAAEGEGLPAAEGGKEEGRLLSNEERAAVY